MTKTIPEYTMLDHTADLGVIITGSSLVDLFENAGRTLLHLMFKIRPDKKADLIRISISGNDLADCHPRIGIVFRITICSLNQPGHYPKRRSE